MGVSFAAGLIALAVVAAVLRVAGLADRDLWLDENCTWYWSHHFFAWPSAGPPRWNEPAHLPYFLLLHLWTGVLGDGVAALRGLSAACGTLTVLLVGLLGARLTRPAAALMAAALLAAHPLHVYYSQEARAYALWVLVIWLATWALAEAARRGRARWWALYAVLAYVAVLTHYYALLWLPATVAGIVLARQARSFIRQWLATHALLAVALAPVYVFWILPYLQTGAEDWKTEVWRNTPPALAIPKSLWAMMPSGGYPPDYMGPLAAAGDAVGNLAGDWAPAALRWLPAAVVGVTAAWFCLRRVPRQRSDGPKKNDAFVALFCLSLPVLFLGCAWLAAWIMGRGYIAARYDVAALPVLMLGVGSIVAAIPPPMLRRAVVVVLAACGLATTLGYRSLPADHDLRGRAAFITQHVGPDDLVISVGLYRWFVAYEWQHMGLRAEVVSFPTWHDDQLCWADAPKELEQPAAIDADADAVVGRIQQALTAGRYVWLVAHGEPASARWEVDHRFFARLAAAGIEVRPVDEWVGLAELRRQVRTQP